MALLSRTKGVLSQIVDDVKRISFWSNILVQIIFFIFYIYSICISINHLTILILYSILLLFASITFITFLITHLRKIKKPKRFYRLLRFGKYFTNGTLIALNIYAMVKYGATDWNKIILSISLISLLIHIIIEGIKILIEKYAKYLSIAIENDFSLIVKWNNIKEGKSTLLSIVNSPLETIANKLEHKEVELTEDEVYVNQLADKYEEESYEKKFQHNAEVKERKKETNQTARKNIVNNLKRIKNSLFKNRQKQNDTKSN